MSSKADLPKAPAKSPVSTSSKSKTSDFDRRLLARAAKGSSFSSRRDSLNYLSRTGAKFEFTEAAIVIDLGSRYIKVGFVNEPFPRKIYTTRFVTGNRRLSKPHPYQKFKEGKVVPPQHLFLTSYPLSPGTWDQILELLVHDLIFTHLQVKPAPSTHRNVFICEDPFWPKFFTQSLARKLFETGQDFRIAFADGLALPLFTTKGDTGIVLDVGFCCTKIQAVVGGHVLVESRMQHPVGMANVLQAFKEQMKKMTRGQLDFDKLQIADDQVEAAVCRICFVQSPESDSEERPRPKAVAYEFPTNAGTAYCQVPGNVRANACEALFGENEHGENLALVLADCLMRVPLDCRPVLASKILICGGTANLPGLHYRCLRELKRAIEIVDDYEPLRMLQHRIHFLQVKNFKLNTLAWVGAAIYGALNLPEEHFITRENFDGKIPEKRTKALPPRRPVVPSRDTLGKGRRTGDEKTGDEKLQSTTE